MLLATARHKSVFLLDFLAPFVLSRTSRKYSLHRPGKGKSPPSLLYPLESINSLKKSHNVTPPIYGLDPAQVDLFREQQAILSSACDKNDPHAVAATLREIDGCKLIHLLPPAQVDAALQTFLTALSSAGNLDPSDEAWFTRFALQTATSSTSSTDALGALLLLRLSQKNFAAVIDLYTSYMEGVENKEIWNNEGQEGESHEDLLVSDESRRDARIETGRMTLLLAVTAAHASQNNFQAALETCLKSHIRFHHPTLEVFLAKNFAQDEAFAAKLKRFFTRLDIARLVSRPPSLSKHIINLASAHSVKQLEALYQSIIDGLHGPDAYIAADPSMTTPQKSVALTDVIWNSFLSSFLKRRRRDLASKIWADQTALGITPGIAFWTTLIDAYGSMNELNDAVASWNMMKAERIQPDALAYRALISAYFKGRKSAEALRVFRTFQKLHLKGTSETHLRSVYNTTIDGLLSFNEEATVEKLLQEMQSGGPTADLVTYNTILAYYGRRGNFKGLASIVGRMVELKVVGDVYTFSTILTALLKIGRDDAPDLLIGIMRKQGVQPNVATYSAIIAHQMRNPTLESLKVVMRLLQRMDEDSTTKPNVKTYTSILAGLPRVPGANSTQIDDWWREVTERMVNHGIEPNQATYHVLIEACLRRESRQGLKDALQYYRKMRQQHLMNDTSWYIVLLGLSRRGELSIGEEVIQDMLASGHGPSIAVQRLMGQITRQSNSQ